GARRSTRTQTPPNGATANVSDLTAATKAVVVSGGVTNGETWTVTVAGTAYNYTVTAADHEANDIARGLAAAIDGPATGFVATAEDNTLVVGRPGDGHRPRLAVGDAAAHHDGFGRGRDVGGVRRSAVRGGCRQVEPAAAGLGDDQRGVLGAGGEPDNRVDLCSEF